MRWKYIGILFLGASAMAQSEAAETAALRNSTGGHYDREEAVSGRLIPVPFLYLGPSIMGGGYAPLAYRVEGGVGMEATHIVFQALGAYDNGHKVYDGDQPNPKGRDRYLDSGLYFRPARHGWSRQLYFGGGYTWTQLSTTNYTKGAGRAQIGGGIDWFVRTCDPCRRVFSMRVSMDWQTVGQDWQNGSHGPNMGFVIPSPREKRHWFYREQVGVYRFHETVTEPYDLPLTRLQRSDKSSDEFIDMGILYRF